MARNVFVTGTDTGVGKTAVTALLLAHAQASRIKSRALKPISTGGGGDEALLASLQSGDFAVNAFNFPEPISPWTSARLHGISISKVEVLERIMQHQSKCDLLLIEGAGGLLTPLGDRFNISDLIAAMAGEVILVAANRLGVLNHTLLTVHALQQHFPVSPRIALIEQAGADLSRKTNFEDLKQLLPKLTIVNLPYLPNYMPEAEFIRAAALSLRPQLSELLTGKKNPPDTDAEGTFP